MRLSEAISALRRWCDTPAMREGDLASRQRRLMILQVIGEVGNMKNQMARLRRTVAMERAAREKWERKARDHDCS